MRVIIAGGRDYRSCLADIDWLDELRSIIPISTVICGMARGADTFGKTWATNRAIHVSKFYADWKTYPGFAGNLRNKAMAEKADALIAFPGGTGTRDMIARADKKMIPVYLPYSLTPKERT